MNSAPRINVEVVGAINTVCYRFDKDYSLVVGHIYFTKYLEKYVDEVFV